MASEPTDQGKARLGTFLEETFNAKPPVDIEPPKRGVNAGTHLVAVDDRGQRFSIKYVSGHDVDTRPPDQLTENILLAGRLSKLLDTPSHIECAMLWDATGLGPLEGHVPVVRKWHGVGIREVDLAVRGSADYLRQYGEWCAFGLLFALCDGKPEHWTWDSETQTMGRNDLETIFWEWGKRGDFLGPATGAVRRGIASGDGPEYDAFTDGLRAMVEKFHEQRADVEAMSPSDWPESGHPTDGVRWRDRAPDDFVRLVVEKFREVA